MKRFGKRALTVLLCLAFCAALLPAGVLGAGTVIASGLCGDDVTWTLDSSGAMTLSGSGRTWDFRNDASRFDYHPCPWEEWKDSIRQVIVKDGITYIGASAFDSCENLERVSFPESLIQIEAFAFAYCRKLAEYTLPPKLESLGQESFRWSAIKTVTIPGSVTFLDNGFCNCPNLKTVRIEGDPNAPGYVYGSYLFSSCPALSRIEVTGEHISLRSADGVLFSKSGNALVAFPAGYSNSSYRIPSGTEVIWQGAFDFYNGKEYFPYVRQLIVPNSVAAIDPLNSLYRIREVLFEGDAPSGLEEALALNFQNCPLMTVYYPKDNPTWTEVIAKAAGHEEITWAAMEAPMIFGLSADRSAAEIGETVTWTAAAAGSGSLRYNFYVCKDGAVIHKTGYTAATTVGYTVTEPGTYSVKVFVKDEAGTVVNLTGGSCTVTAPAAEPLAVSGLRVNKTSAALGDTLTWTAFASGGSGSLQYNFYVYQDGAIVQKGGYTAANTFSYAAAETGTYTAKVYVKDSAATVVAQTGGSCTVGGSSAPLAVSGVSINKTSAAPGDILTWTAAATGGSGTLRYNFYVYQDGAVVQKTGYTTAKTAAYTAADTGTYSVKVYVKDSAGTVVTKTGGSCTVGGSSAPLAVSGLSVSKTSAASGDTLTWTASASGGTGTLRYNFYVYKDGVVVQKGGYAAAKTFSYTAAEAGTYSVKVYVKDGAGTIVTKTGGACLVS